MRLNIKAKVKKGIFWVFTHRLFIRLISFLRISILARLLTSGDYGLSGIVTNVMLFVDVFTRTGFQIALIQKKENIEDYLDVAWTLNLIRGIIETLAIIALIKPLASFYEQPLLVPLLLFASTATLITGFESIQMVVLNKKLQMRKLSLFAIIGSMLSFLFTLGLAFWTRNVWALVGGFVIQKVISSLGSYVIAPYRPKFCLDKAKAKELWSFGKWEYMSGLLITFFMHGDDLFVGKVLGVSELGFYSMAYNIGNSISFELVDSFRKVLFPAFSSFQNNISRLRSSYLSVYHITAFIGCILAIGLSLLSQQFVDIMLGEKWIPIIPSLQILAIWGGVQMLSTSTAPLFRAVNRPDLFAKVQLVKLVILLILIFPLTRWWGIAGTALSVLVSSLAELPVGIIWTKQILECKYKNILIPLIPPITSGVIVTIIYNISHETINLSAQLHLLIFGIMILILYLFLTLLIDKITNAGLIQELKNTIK